MPESVVQLNDRAVDAVGRSDIADSFVGLDFTAKMRVDVVVADGVESGFPQLILLFQDWQRVAVSSDCEKVGHVQGASRVRHVGVSRGAQPAVEFGSLGFVAGIGKNIGEHGISARSAYIDQTVGKKFF